MRFRIASSASVAIAVAAVLAVACGDDTSISGANSVAPLVDASVPSDSGVTPDAQPTDAAAAVDAAPTCALLDASYDAAADASCTSQ
jgi:hypothetical protein